jgi:GntR family transcriptional regulator
VTYVDLVIDEGRLAVIESAGRPGSLAVPAVPLSYRGIADDLAARIRVGEYPPGAQLPSYAQIAALYSVSVSTAQRAVGLLRDRGVAVGEQGRGVYVADRTNGG